MIYAQVGPLSLARLERYAGELGIDPVMIIAGMQDADTSALIDHHRKIAIALEVRGTPTFVSPRRLHVGAVTPDILSTLAGGS